jgi:hypothetical protein
MRTVIPDTTNNLLVGAAALFLGVLHTYLFFSEMIGLNYPLFIIAALLCGLVLSRVFGRRLTRDTYVLIGFAIFFSSMVFVRESELLTFFNILGSILLVFIVVDQFSGKQLQSFLIKDFLSAATLPFRCIGPFFETAPMLLSFRNDAMETTKKKEIVRGIIMAAIALVLFTWLLAGADAYFARIFNAFFTFTLDAETIPYIVRTLFVTAFFVGAFGFMFLKHHEEVTTRAEGIRKLGLIETSILLGTINVLFCTFIVFQISTLFGGATHLTAEGLTYAEYARNGFVQLVWVAIFSFIIISYAEAQVVMRESGHMKLFKVLSGTLVLLVVTILVSAYLKLSLYEAAYGFTDIRLYSHALMIWLAGGLILLFAHIIQNDRREVLAQRLFYSVIIFLLALNVLNPDVFIAQKNLERYKVTGDIDALYLARLSHDALPYTIGLLTDVNETVRADYAYGLSRTTGNCSNDVCDTTWKTMHPGDKKTESLLEEYNDRIESNRNLLRECSEYGDCGTETDID